MYEFIHPGKNAGIFPFLPFLGKTAMPQKVARPRLHRSRRTFSLQQAIQRLARSLRAAFPAKVGLLAVAFSAEPSIAQTVRSQVPGSLGQPPPREYRTDSPSYSAREAEFTQPPGIPLGTFKLYPQIEFDETYNDNVYATPATQGITPALVQQFKGAIALRSDWARHMVNFFANSSVAFYSVDAPSNNYQDVSVGADGRLDIQRNLYVSGAASWNRLHEAPGTPNSVSQPGTPTTIYNQFTTAVGAYEKFNRVSVRIDGRLDNFQYEPNSLGPTQGVIPNADRNRNEFRESLRLSYELFPGSEVWVRSGFNQRVYSQLDASGLDRGSSGFDVVGGILLGLGGITSIEAFAGFLQQNYQSSQFQNVSVPTFGLIGYWNPYQPLWIRPFVQRTVDDTALTTSAAFINTTMGIETTYYVRPNVTFEGTIGYDSANYLGQAGVQGTRFDQYGFVRAALLYSLTRRIFVGPQYQYIRRWSNQPNNDFDQNLIMLRLGARF